MSNMIAIVIAVLIRVESGGDRWAVGDGGRAVGILQQHRVSVVEANRIVGYCRWTYSDRLDPVESLAMCRVTLERQWRRGVRDPVALACRWRNPNGHAPKWYRKRIETAMKEGDL